MGNISLFHEPLSVSVTKGTNFDETLYVYGVPRTNTIVLVKTKQDFFEEFDNFFIF